MDLGQILHDLWFDYTLRTVALGAGVLGIVSGALGSFAVLRRQSLLGDAMSHAALPGIVLAFLLTGSKAPLALMLGALAAGWAGALVLMGIASHSRIKQDSALGLVLSVFFGFGLVLLTFVQRRPDASQAGLDRFLFGQAATLLEREVLAMALLGGLALLVLGLLWKEFKLLSFDAGFAASQGYPVGRLDAALTTLLAVAIVVGLQAVGVVLMSAMLVAPAAAARQWTDRLGRMVALSAFFGALAGVSGTVLSSLAPGLSTGPTIVLAISALVVFSLLLAPNRGLIWAWARRLRSRRRLQAESVLRSLYSLAVQHDDPGHAHSVSVLRMMNAGEGGVRRTLEALQTRGLVRRTGDDHWALTPAGFEQARRLEP